MEVTEFHTFDELARDAAELLAEHLCAPRLGPHAVLLTGGKTVRGVYARLVAAPVRADPNLHVLLTDERHVPVDDPESNYGHMRGLLAACGVDEARIHRVRTELDLDAAAARYDAELAAFFAAGGEVTLGFLGLGADGHVASLFSAEDVARGAGRCALAVRRPSGPARVSITRDVLWRVTRLAFLVAGPDKAGAIDRLIHRPATIPAGIALAEKDHVELWCAP